MDTQGNEERRHSARQRKIRLLAGLFIGSLLVFTLLGNTLQGLTLPKVLIAEASPGELVHSYEGTAMLQYEAERALPNPAGWKVARVLVQEGDKVRKGDTLVEYDPGEAQQQLVDMKASLEKLKLSLGGLEAAYKQAAQDGDEAAKQNAKAAIETANIDISAQGQHLAALQQSLEENRRLKAPFDGIVIEVAAEEGLASAGEPDIRMSNATKGFRMELQIPNDVGDLLRIGDELDVLLPDRDNLSVAGKISGLKAGTGGGASGSGTNGTAGDAAPGQLLTVSLQGEDLRSGEKARITVEKSGNAGTLLIPNAAVREDDAGAFVYTVESREGPLGNAHYVVRTEVDVAGSNGHATSVVGGLFEGQQIIVDSTDPIIEGSRVRY
ncbi:efflux RND transporter periplasmic adaptor subunit [Paenibacillus macerans]|uniref:efflux RND transporter periplasmic adaptor subunit n=1 Tax=Paenibacillus macerans TaxID=44252 RepID=UPI003D3134D2